MAWPVRWFDSFFSRLLLVQVLLALLLAGLFWGWGARKQGEDLGLLLAPSWAAALQARGTLPVDVPVTAAVSLLPGPPPPDAADVMFLWRYRVLPAELQRLGVVVHDIKLNGRDGGAVVWLQVDRRDGGGREWVGVRSRAGGMDLRLSVWAATGVAAAAILGVIWGFSRWVARPLSDLQRAMRRFEADAVVPGQFAQSAPAELRDLAQQFAGLARLSSEADERRRMMMAGISHDLRSPLGRIRLAAELLPQAAGVEKRRSSIARDVRVADRLLDSFIDFARAEDEEVKGRVDLRALVMDLAAQEPDVRIEDLPERAQWLEPASAVALERALRNLLDNARHYGAAPICLALKTDARESVLSVRDHGPGVPASAFSLVTQPFFRGEASRQSPGTGLGLAIVHRTTTRHGGRLLLVEAHPGLRVELRLPPCRQG
jgi:two-component system osmolarity sensor histidine kinase EnvZ